MTAATVQPPRALRLLRGSKRLEVDFGEKGSFLLPCALLRKRSPAADAGSGEPARDITILKLEPVGNYAVRPVFSDGHATGIFTWRLLRELCMETSEADE